MSKRKINDDEPNIDDNRVLPHIKPYREKLGDVAVKCFCGYYGITVEQPTKEIGYSTMECFVFNSQRHATGCKNRGWAWCVTCGTKLTKTNLAKHQRSARHQMNAGKLHQMNAGKLGAGTVPVQTQTNVAGIKETN